MSVMDKVRAPAPADAERVTLAPAEVERVKAALLADGETNGHRKNRTFLADVVDLACATGIRMNEVCALNREHVELFERGGRLDKQVPARLFTAYVELARLEKSPTFHSLRHTFITWCAKELGLPIPVFQRLAGHEMGNTTMGYVHTSGDTVMEAVERSLAFAGLATPDEQRRRASSASAEMAGAEAYDAYLDRRGSGSSRGRRGEYVGNAPPRASRTGRSGVVVEGAKSA